MTWTDLLPSLSELASSGVVFTIVSLVGYFFRERISKMLDAGIQHRFDAKLEILKENLAGNSRKIEDLRSSVLNIRTQRQVNVDRRRLEAVDQLWSAVKVLSPLRGNCVTMSIIKWPDAAVGTKEDPEVRIIFEKISSNLPEQLPILIAHESRPYISPLSWALFSAYQTVLHYSYMQMIVLRTGVGPDVINSVDNLSPIILVALPDWSERIKNLTEFSLPSVAMELESRLLAELRRNLEGVDDDRAEVERAEKIVALVSTAQTRAAEAGLAQQLRR